MPSASFLHMAPLVLLIWLLPLLLLLQGEAQGVTIMLMHGLLGSGRNWRSFARRLVADAESR